MFTYYLVLVIFLATIIYLFIEEKKQGFSTFNEELDPYENNLTVTDHILHRPVLLDS
jgi:hypothetical protein